MSRSVVSLASDNKFPSCFLRLLQAMEGRSTKFKKITIQLDNCGRENKNKWVKGFLQTLRAFGFADEIEVFYLPVG